MEQAPRGLGAEPGLNARTTMSHDDLPTDKFAMQKLAPEFERLDPDSPDGCPCTLADVRKYLRADPAAGRADLFFGRTARIGTMRFWLWGFAVLGKTVYVAVEQEGTDAGIVSGSGEGLSPEQYLGLRYARTLRDKRRQ